MANYPAQMAYPGQPMLQMPRSQPYVSNAPTTTVPAPSFVTKAPSPQARPQQMSIGTAPNYQTPPKAPNVPYTSAQRDGNAAANGHTPPQRPQGQCEDECAEEECNPDQCGDENRGPAEGLDTRPVLPIALGTSTVLGWVCMICVQIPLMEELFGWGSTGGIVLQVSFGIFYVSILGCMLYCSLCDPGQVKESGGHSSYSGVEDQQPLPKRAHKTWQYPRPIRRYDHYCRWLVNCIGLLNHREFMALLIGLFTICVIGIILDPILFYTLHSQGKLQEYTLPAIFVGIHLFYSMVLSYLEFPILKIHFGLISRNELAHEWKKNEFYIAKKCKRGVNVHVNELSDDEFNDLFDEFEYDGKRNKFDKGRCDNCWSFWCAARWEKKQKGEF